MVIDKIITQNELNYIETLYLYANLEDFISYKSTALNHYLGQNNQLTNKKITQKDIDNLYGEEKYTYMLEYVHDTMLHEAEYLGEVKARSWYKFDNYRLGIMNYDTAKKSNQFNVEIQYYQHHMFSLGEKLKGLELPFGGTFEHYQIRRIDLTQIVKTPIDYLTNHGFISSFRKIHKEGTLSKVETIYLGHRKNGNLFRMYNKTIELLTDSKEHPIDHKKIELFSRYFGDIEDLYTFELELHRKYLKANYGIEKLSDLEKIYSVYGEIVGKIGIYEDNDFNRKLLKNNNRNRIEIVHFTEYKEFKRLNKKRYKPSKYYAIDKAVTAIERYEKSMGDLSEADKILMLDEIANRLLKKDIDISINSDEYDKIENKFNIIRDNQGNSLEIESKRAFLTAPTLLQNPKNLF